MQRKGSPGDSKELVCNLQQEGPERPYGMPTCTVPTSHIMARAHQDILAALLLLTLLSRCLPWRLHMLPDMQAWHRGVSLPAHHRHLLQCVWAAF